MTKTIGVVMRNSERRFLRVFNVLMSLERVTSALWRGSELRPVILIVLVLLSPILMIEILDYMKSGD